MNFKKVFREIWIWLGLSVMIGVLGGAIGAGLFLSVSAVTVIRENNSWLIFLLPVAGLLSVAVSGGLRSSGFGTKAVIDCSKDSEKSVPLNLSFSVFAGTVLTHLCGGSAGKEGAALQIGGGLSAVISKIFKIDKNRQKTLILCAMAALFAAVFGTPLTAAVFVIEAARLKKERYLELMPTGVSAFIGFITANALGVVPERLHIPLIDDVSTKLILVLFVVAIAAAFVGEVFCFALKFIGEKAKQFFKNDYSMIFIGALLVIVITLIIGSYEYNGSSITTLHNIFSNGEIKYEAFALKFILTVITVSFGFKGGQIIPSLFIGAALGGAIGMLLGVSVPIAAAVGLAASFCSVTNCTVSSVLLCLELFSGRGILYLAVASVISRLVSGKINLYGDTPPIFKIFKKQ